MVAAFPLAVLLNFLGFLVVLSVMIIALLALPEFRGSTVDPPLKKIMDNGVRMVGIHGSGGIRKMRLAKAIFNKISPNFEFSSFISNIREVCAQHNGLISLQNQLIRQLS
ncbi:hypothetical protein EJ110_NYTH55665 [Nymphaea thermarum]|nr:hypothetical protein EJ110_NYTH55665 [Nymphaea thermarum]